jgi:hypothetical protein
VDGSVAVSGIVDWENARIAGLPDCDLIHLWITSQPDELGMAVRRAVQSPETVRIGITELPATWTNPQLPTANLVLLAWLWHVTAELNRATRNRVGRLWLARTVMPVLKLVSSGAAQAIDVDVMSTVTSPPTQVETPAAPERRQIYQAILRSDWLLLALPIASVALWILGLAGADPRAMNDLGLLSLFSPANVAALVVLATGMIIGLYRGVQERFLALQLVTYLALIHATPVLLYGTLRYSWAWKHVGIVDYILRHGYVDRFIEVSGIYHNWPGFFAANALLTTFGGRQNLLTIASWAPFAFNLMNLVVLRFVLRGLTQDKRVIWLSLWFFFIINWVGQDYFSPQAIAYVLYLACVGLLIRGVTGWGRIALFIVLVTTVAISHQLTPIVLFIVVTGLVVLRRTSGWYLPLIAFAVPATWALTFARPYAAMGFSGFFDTFGQPLQNANDTFEKARIGNIAEGLVVWGGRGVVALSAVVALIGIWRCWRNRTLQLTAVVLMILPGALVFVTGFDGEILFRVVLFAAPFVAFNAATAVIPRPGQRVGVAASAAIALLTALFFPGFLLGYYGKERQNYFTPGEVQAAAWVSEHARPSSLLVEGSRNYPTQFENYENFVYVTIDREPPDSWRKVVADPAGVLSNWLEDPRYTDAYILITRSQEIEVDITGLMPPGSLKSIESALRRSPQFTIAFENGDATVFALRTK